MTKERLKKIKKIFFLLLVILLSYTVTSSPSFASKNYSMTIFFSGIVCEVGPPGSGRKCEQAKCFDPQVIHYSASPNLSVPFSPTTAGNRICVVAVFGGQCGTQANGSVGITYACP